MTPNTSVNLSTDSTEDCVDGVDDRTTDSGIDDEPTKAIYKIMNAQSLGSITTTTTTIIRHKKHSQIYVNADHRQTFDQVDSGLDEKYPDSFGAIYRMKSLGNLTQYERAFGDTPKDLLMLKEEFERKRFGLARRKSLTNLLMDNENESIVESIILPIKRDSIFTAKTGPINGKYKKRIGIGDTKYIGNDEPACNDAKHYQLTKIKSLGTIPMASDRISYEPFLTPEEKRRHPVSLHDYRTSNPVGESTSSSSDGDDDNAVFQRTAQEHLRFMKEVSLLKDGPFERGFRRSYNTKDTHQFVKPTTPLRQSDGYFKIPHFPIFQRAKRPNTDAHTRSSLHNLSTNGKTDLIRYEGFDL